MTAPENSQSKAGKGLSDRADSLFQKAVVAFIVAIVVVVPLLLWLAKTFFGWQPPEAITSLLKMFS